MQTNERQAHWQNIYQIEGERDGSWFQESPTILISFTRPAGGLMRYIERALYAFSSEVETGSRVRTRQNKIVELGSDSIRTKALVASDDLAFAVVHPGFAGIDDTRLAPQPAKPAPRS
jgi:hypothetical protein